MSDGLVAALARCQAKFPPIVKGQTAKVPTKTGGQYEYSYADLAVILAAVRPVLAEEGIVVSQATMVDRETGGVELITTLMLGDDTIMSVFPLHIAGLNAQGVGSLMTYQRRYQLCAILAVHPVGDDDDGNLAATAQTRTEPVEDEDLADLRRIAQEEIGALTASEKDLVATWIRNNKVPSLKRPGATLDQLVALAAFIGNLPEEPWTDEPSTEPPPKPEPESIPFNPVVANAGSVRKGTNSAMKADT